MHEDYHKITDEVEKIDYSKMKSVAQYSFWLAKKWLTRKSGLRKINLRIYNQVYEQKNKVADILQPYFFYSTQPLSFCNNGAAIE